MAAALMCLEKAHWTPRFLDYKISERYFSFLQPTIAQLSQADIIPCPSIGYIGPQLGFEDKWEKPPRPWGGRLYHGAFPTSMSGPGGLIPTHWHIEAFLVSLNNPNWIFFLNLKVESRSSGKSRGQTWMWFGCVVVAEVSADQPVVQEPRGAPSKGRGGSQALPAALTPLPAGCGGGSTQWSSNERSHNQHRLKPPGQ